MNRSHAMEEGDATVTMIQAGGKLEGGAQALE